VASERKRFFDAPVYAGLFITKEAAQMDTGTLLVGLYVFMLAGFIGYMVITGVPPLLHTPLMAATNAISGISLVASLVAAGADYNSFSTVLGTVAVICATINVVGGFYINDRMLKMFKKGKDVKK